MEFEIQHMRHENEKFHHFRFLRRNHTTLDVEFVMEVYMVDFVEMVSLTLIQSRSVKNFEIRPNLYNMISNTLKKDFSGKKVNLRIIRENSIDTRIETWLQDKYIDPTDITSGDGDQVKNNHSISEEDIANYPDDIPLESSDVEKIELDKFQDDEPQKEGDKLDLQSLVKNFIRDIGDNGQSFAGAWILLGYLISKFQIFEEIGEKKGFEVQNLDRLSILWENLINDYKADERFKN